MKFDGVQDSRDSELVGPQVLCRIEYAYHLMAQAVGIRTEDCRLHEKGGRVHFLTRRFDRTPCGGNLHMQSLGALMHYDYHFAGAYEQVLQVIVRPGLPMEDAEQQVRRSFFNILARNKDDHVKNIAFLMPGAFCLGSSCRHYSFQRVQFLLQRQLRLTMTGPCVPVPSIRQIAFAAMQPGMDAS
jgi:serine/threonine-protein kinase HipA